MSMSRLTDSVALLLLVLAEVAGGFTLARWGPEYDLGVLGTIRLWLVLGFTGLVVASRVRDSFPRKAPALALGVGISVLHLLLLVSMWWSPNLIAVRPELLHIVLIVVTMPLAAMLYLTDTTYFQLWTLRILFVLGLAVLPVAFLGFSAISAELTLRAVGSIRIARTAGLGAVAASGLWAFSGRRAWLLPVPLMVLVMVASGNRASVLAFMLALGPLLLLTKKSRLIGATVFLGLLAGIGAWFVPLVQDVVRFFFSYAIWEANGRIYLADRGFLFTNAIRLFRESPWIGQGLGGYFAGSGMFYAYPHNLTLNFASELGLAGLVPFVAMIGVGFLAGLRRAPPAQVAMASVFTYLFVAAQFSGTYGDAFLMWVALVSLVARSTPPVGEAPHAPFPSPSHSPTFDHGTEPSAGP